MKNRLLCVAMAFFCAIGMISCGNPAVPEEFEVTTDNVDEYVLNLSPYEGLTVEANQGELTDELVEYYANFYFSELAKKTEGMLTEDGEPISMTNEAIEMLGSDVFKTVNEFMVFVRNTVENYLVYSYEQEIVEDVIDEVISTSDFADIPEGLTYKEEQLLIEKYSDIAAQYGIDVPYYLELCGTPIDELAKHDAKKELVYYKIAKDNKIEVHDFDTLCQEISDLILDVTTVK